MGGKILQKETKRTKREAALSEKSPYLCICGLRLVGARRPRRGRPTLGIDMGTFCVFEGVGVGFRQHGFLGNRQKFSSDLGEPSGDRGFVDSRVPGVFVSGGGYVASSEASEKAQMK